MQNYFNDLNKFVSQNIKGSEIYSLWFSSELMDFARFSKAKIRQLGNVKQAYLDIRLINNSIHASLNLGLTHNLEQDKTNIVSSLNKLRDIIIKSSPDPYFLMSQSHEKSCFIDNNSSFNKEEIIEDVLSKSSELDLVGYYCGGPIYKGFASSYGQINWYQKSSFFIDSSVYHSNDKAIKQCYADTTYKKDVFLQKLQNAKMALEMFSKPSKILEPKKYNVYFSPAAVFEILSMLNWGGFSQKSLEVKNSPLCALSLGQKSLNSKFSISENTGLGIGPNFQSNGFIKSDKTDLIKEGKFVSGLISPKTAKEYSLEHNSSDEEESACSLDMSAGELESKYILSNLNNGLYINNLWYLNFSDRQNGRITGMTRFFCYVVENGIPTHAFGVMRFDDSIYRIFGDKLLSITKDRELIIDTSTYEERSTVCATLPGILAQDVSFTL
jgi:predicted Zn-dependent protease